MWLFISIERYFSILILVSLFLPASSILCYHDFRITETYVTDVWPTTQAVRCDEVQKMCRMQRSTNGTHYLAEMACADRSLLAYECTLKTRDMTAAERNEFIFCYDVPDKIRGIKGMMTRECCCGGSMCNTISQVMSVNSIYPFDAIKSEDIRLLYELFISLCVCSMLVTIAVFCIYILLGIRAVFRAAHTEDAFGWTDEGERQEMKVNLTETEEEDERRNNPDEESAAAPSLLESKLSRKSPKKSHRKSHTRRRQRRSKGEPKKDGTDETQSGEDGHEGKVIQMVRQPKVLKDGRLQHISMLNENSTFSDLEYDNDKSDDREKKS